MTNFAFIGDVHSQSDLLELALNRCESYDLTPILLGDLFDSRCNFSDSYKCYELVRKAEQKLGAFMLQSNHQDKLIRYLKGNPVKLTNGLNFTISELGVENNINSEFSTSLLNWLVSQPYGIVLRDNNNVEYRCAHAFFSSKINVPAYAEYHLVSGNDMSRKLRDLFVYGPVSKGERVVWWESERSYDYVRVAGHYHTVHIDDNSLVLDGCCGSNDEGVVSSLILYDVNQKQMHRFYRS